MPLNRPAKPFFLKDALAMKRQRGDADCENFKAVMSEFASGQYATIEGAIWSVGKWIEKRDKWVSDARHANRIVFIADLHSIENGTFFPAFMMAAE